MARFQLRLFAAGIVVIAAFSILFYLTQHSIPFWKNPRNFGPFPNRNQTADLFGVTSVLILAAAQDDIRYGRKRWILLDDRADYCHRGHLSQFFARGRDYSRGCERNLDRDRRASARCPCPRGACLPYFLSGFLSPSSR